MGFSRSDRRRAWTIAVLANLLAAGVAVAQEAGADPLQERLTASAQALDRGEIDAADAAAAEALMLAGDAAAMRARAVWGQARVRNEQGRYPDALALLDEAERLAGGADAQLAASIAYDRARAFDGQGEYARAEAAALDSLERRRALYGQVHDAVADALNLYANALAAQGRHAEADPAYRQVLGMYEVLHGPKAPRVAIVLSNLANSLRRTGRWSQADPLYRRAVVIARASQDKVLLAQCLNNYGWFLHLSGDGPKAERQFRPTLELALEIVGPEHPFTGVARANLAYALMDQGRAVEAEPLFAEGLRVLAAGIGQGSPDLLETLRGYAAALKAQGRLEEAEPLLRRASAIATERLQPIHSERLRSSDALAGLMLASDRPDAALEELRRSLAPLRRRSGAERDWRTAVRDAGPLFAREVEAAWALAERRSNP